MKRRDFLKTTALGLAGACLDRKHSNASIIERLPLWSRPYDTVADNPVIVWIVADTLRADHIGCYGYPRDTTPFMDYLSKRGALFYNAIAPSSWTLPSFTTMLTGLYPTTHGMITPSDFYEGESLMLAEILRNHGFNTAAFQTNSFVNDHFGLLRGFDTKYQYEDWVGEPFENIYDMQLMDKLISWLDNPENRSGKVFLFIGLISPHTPYMPDDNILRSFTEDGLVRKVTSLTCEDLVATTDPLWLMTASYLTTDRYPWLDDFYGDCSFEDPRGNFDPNLWISGYDGDIRQTDMLIERIVHHLHEAGLWNRTLLIITSDHGEIMAEKPEIAFSHGKSLNEGVIHVPLIICAPELDSGDLISHPVNLIDLTPTVLDYAGIEIPLYMQGTTLIPMLTNQLFETQDIVFSHLLALLPELGDTGGPQSMFAEFWCARGSQFKLLKQGNNFYFYDLENDPFEERNLIDAPYFNNLIQEMINSLHTWIKETTNVG